MTETKQHPKKKYSEYFLKSPDTNLVPLYQQKTNEFSFDILNKFDTYIPIVFINSNDNEIASAIEIDCQNILSKSEKKIDPEKRILNTGILEMLLKYHFDDKQTVNVLKFEERRKTRLLVKRGPVHIPLLFNDIALIYTKDKVVYVINRDSKKYLMDKTLTELEQELDSTIFFRANRQYIVNLNFIKSFKVYQKVKLILDINIVESEAAVIISQQVAPAFKKWMNDA